MKKIIKTIASFSLISAILASCAKEAEHASKDDSRIDGKMVEITINASSNNTKTYIDGTSVKWGASGEYLKVLQDKDGSVSNANSSEGVTSDGGATMQFAVSFTEATGDAFNYYAFYPASALNGTPAVNATKINTPANQTPTATSFDPAADLLIAQKVNNGSTQATSLDMKFSRAIAVGKMTITNLASSEDVKKVIFSAKDGSTPIKVAGRTEFSLATAKPTGEYANNVAETSIILDYSALSLKANSSMDVFFTCYPFEITADDSFTVEVQTATQSFTRTVTLTGAQQIVFSPGSASRFSVDMSTAAEESIAVDLPYACLTAAEYNAAGGKGSYGNVTVTKPHGDKWETYAMYNSSSIQIRNSSDPGSFVKLPVFVEDIKTVNITLSSAIAADKKLTLETTADGTEGSILSLNTVGGQTSYTFDLTSKTVKTAYLRSVGAAAKVLKIEVLAGTDTRAAKISAPSTLSAGLNGSNPNAIDVTWTAVAEAAGYEITLTPTSGDAVVRTAASDEVSLTISGLTASTTYTPSIVTIADPYLYKANSDVKACSAVTTGSLHVSDITSAGTYTLEGLTVMAVNGSNVIASDVTGAILIYKSSHGLAINDVFNITGGVEKYNGVWEFKNSITITKVGTTTAVYPTPVTYNADKITSYATAPVTEYATATGTANSTARTVTVADGKVLNVYGDLSSVDGKQVIVNGYAFGYNSSKVNFMLVGTPTLDPSVPSLITSPVDGSTIEWDNDEYGDGNAQTITVTLNGAATGYTVSSGTTSWTVSNNGSGTITVYPNAANESTSDDKTLDVVITHNDDAGVTSTITLKQNKKGGVNYATTYTSNVTIDAGSNSSAASVVINTTEYGAIKAGTGKKAGVATVTVPSGTTKLHVHIAGWNGDNHTINVTPAEKISKINGVTATSLTNTSDSGISGTGSTFTLAGTTKFSTDYYFVIDLTGITSDTVITFTAGQASNNRFVIWGCNAE